MKKKYFVEVGERYGRWTVIAIRVPHIKPSGSKTYLTKCRCECGREGNLETSTLSKGMNNGCICCVKLGRIPWNKDKKGVYSEETINKISLAQIGIRKSPRTEFKKGQIPWNKDKKYEQITGDKHYLWRKDREQVELGKKRWCSKECDEWRKEVFKRDNWKCQLSNEKCDGRLEAHHILPWIDYPENRFDINNGITLCHSHHPRKRVDVEKQVSFFQSRVTENEIISSKPEEVNNA